MKDKDNVEIAGKECSSPSQIQPMVQVVIAKHIILYFQAAPPSVPDMKTTKTVVYLCLNKILIPDFGYELVK